MTGSFAQILEQNAARSPGCWLWTLGTNSRGYGQFCSGGRSRLAHRAAWEVANGAIPSGMYVCHHCDTPACVNPAHLFLGTASDNARDREAKGRSARNTNGNENKSHCPAGHTYTPANTGRSSAGRYCRACRVRDRQTFKARRLTRLELAA
jgi:hypothetical protein